MPFFQYTNLSARKTEEHPKSVLLPTSVLQLRACHFSAAVELLMYIQSNYIGMLVYILYMI